MRSLRYMEKNPSICPQNHHPWELPPNQGFQLDWSLLSWDMCFLPRIPSPSSGSGALGLSLLNIFPQSHKYHIVIHVPELQTVLSKEKKLPVLCLSQHSIRNARLLVFVPSDTFWSSLRKHYWTKWATAQPLWTLQSSEGETVDYLILGSDKYCEEKA